MLILFKYLFCSSWQIKDAASVLTFLVGKECYIYYNIYQIKNRKINVKNKLILKLKYKLKQKI